MIEVRVPVEVSRLAGGILQLLGRIGPAKISLSRIVKPISAVHNFLLRLLFLLLLLDRVLGEDPSTLHLGFETLEALDDNFVLNILEQLELLLFECVDEQLLLAPRLLQLLFLHFEVSLILFEHFEVGIVAFFLLLDPFPAHLDFGFELCDVHLIAQLLPFGGNRCRGPVKGVQQCRLECIKMTIYGLLRAWCEHSLSRI